MAEWLRLCSAEEVAPGTGKGVEVMGRKLLVVNLEGGFHGFHVVDAVCTHMGGDLARGKIENGKVVCPRHGATYDPVSGKLVKDVSGAVRLLTRKGASDLRSYPVRVENGNVLADLG